MKKYIFSLLFFIVVTVSSCSDSVTPVDPYQAQLDQFNNSSGFNAVLVVDTGVVNTAKRNQGHGDYPGVDDWFAVKINNGMVILGGLPGQSAFYSILETYSLSNHKRDAYWKLLQVKPHPIFGYRPRLGSYELNQNLHAAISKTLANPQYGAGGAWQLYIENYQTLLTQFAEITLDTTAAGE